MSNFNWPVYLTLVDRRAQRTKILISNSRNLISTELKRLKIIEKQSSFKVYSKNLN